MTEHRTQSSKKVALLTDTNSTTPKTFNLGKDKDTEFNKDNKSNKPYMLQKIKSKKPTINTLTREHKLNIMIQITSSGSKSKKLSNMEKITLNTSIAKVDAGFKAIKDTKVHKLL